MPPGLALAQAASAQAAPAAWPAAGSAGLAGTRVRFGRSRCSPPGAGSARVDAMSAEPGPASGPSQRARRARPGTPSGRATRFERPLDWAARDPAQLAQPVEHFHGKEGVSGSNPLLGSRPRLRAE